MNRAYIPFVLGLSMAIGVWLGTGLENPFKTPNNQNKWAKVEQVLQYVENDYVDTVSRSRLEEEVIAYLLNRLDPHSNYIAQADLAEMNEPLEGNFEGIGVQFNLRNDSIYVVAAIPDGPSAKAGILPGDFIVIVNDQPAAGQGLDNRGVMAMLKGPEGSTVKVGVKRNGMKGLLNFELTRARIPISSFDAIYQINDTALYLKLSRFSSTTHEEFKSKVYPLLTPNVQRIVLDLRGNGGGYLETASQLADEFLSRGLLITYTEGKNRPRREYRATADGKCEDIAIAVIVDGFSASASEIFAGAIQDHNRGMVIGRRTYGKGLVQEQSEWADGSATRMTVARYYTPSGRSIQRPYNGLVNPAVSSVDTSAGGIIPDVLVEQDTSGVTWFFAELVHSGMLTEFTYNFRDKHQFEWQGIEEEEWLETSLSALVETELRAFLKNREIEIDDKEWNRSIERITLRVKALISRSVYGELAYFKLINQTDLFVQKALTATKKPMIN